MVSFIDMHCDTLTQANMHFQHDLYQLPLEMLDIVKLKKENCMRCHSVFHILQIMKMVNGL